MAQALLRPHDREILRLAFPALLTLITEPLFLLADSAIVGHLGTAQLAGLGIAAAVLQTVVGLCVFLAYGTTGSVARALGAGDRARALAQGVDGLWLAAGIGVLATAIGIPATGPLVSAFGAAPDATDHAATYLRIALLGVTPLLLMLAATGVLRGLQDTRTPLRVAVAANIVNVVLNLLLVYGLGPIPGLGIAGSALGSVLAQVAAAGALVAVVIGGARREGASLRPDLPGIRAAGRASVPLFVRTLTLRAALLVTVYAVTSASGGDSADVAAHQLAFTIWSFLAFVLDAIAIAAQAITGRFLGAGQVGETRAVTRRMIQWGLASGVVTGLGLTGVAAWLGPLFTPDPAVHALLLPALLIAALGQPIAGVVFVLDGVLIGAGDGAYLAWAGLVVLAVYVPVVLVTAATLGTLAWIWIVFSFVFMGARAVVLLARERGDRWLVTGA